jgi:hypothetical protein
MLSPLGVHFKGNDEFGGGGVNIVKEMREQTTVL